VPLRWNGGALEGWQDFCEALGVSFDNDFWEGSITSGHYYLGWLPVGTLRRAKTTARALLKTAERSALKNIKTERLKVLEEIDNLEAFLERTEDDRGSLLETIEVLKRENSDLTERNAGLTKELARQVEKARLSDSSTFDLEILQFACDVFTGRPAPFRAGPLVCWTDGSVYAIVRKGRGDLPAGCSAALLITRLEATGIQVHRLQDNQVVGGWLSGPVYRHGSPHASQWTDVWIETSPRKRTFVADDPAVAAVAAQIAKEANE